MRKYSLFILLAFFCCSVFRVMDIFVVSNTVFRVLFYVSLLLGITLIGLDTLNIKYCVNTVNYDSKYRLDVFSFICVCGLFVDFISSALGVYSCFADASVNAMRTALELMQCVFALIGDICFLMIALSYKKPKRFDFRKLGFFNLFLLLWVVSRCLIGLTDIFELQNTSSVVMYITLIFCFSAIYCFLIEIQSDKIKSFSLFSFRTFGYVGGVCFFTQAVSVIHKDTGLFDEQTLFIFTMGTLSAFFYLLSRDVLSRQKKSGN